MLVVPFLVRRLEPAKLVYFFSSLLLHSPFYFSYLLLILIYSLICSLIYSLIYSLIICEDLSTVAYGSTDRVWKDLQAIGSESLSPSEAAESIPGQLLIEIERYNYLSIINQLLIHY